MRNLQMNNYYGEIITEYLTNYMCFIVLSVEIFSILFTFGVVKSVVVLLFVDTAIFYWIVSSWFGKNGFERERSFMIQILYFRNNNKILFFPLLL